MLEMSEDVFYTAVIFYRVLDIVWWPFVLLQWQEVPLFEWKPNLLAYLPKFFRGLRLFSRKSLFFLAGTAVYALN